MQVKKPVLLFDEGHGQRHWEQTGFPPHTVDGIYSLLVESCRASFNIRSSRERVSQKLLAEVDAFVKPPTQIGI